MVVMLSTWATWYCVLAVHVYSSSVSASNTSCPTWFYYSSTTNQRECVMYAADGFCVTFTKQEGLYYAGDCPFRHTENNTDRISSELPSDPDRLNDRMCGPYNRMGLLCGRCIDGYGPAVYSLDMKCANCSKLSTGYAISLYLLLEFIPITLFFMAIVIFRLNITAGPCMCYSVRLMCIMHRMICS